MLKEWVEGSTIELEEFKGDTFYELHYDCDDTEWDAQHDDWFRGLGFTQWWNEMLPSVGYVEYTGQDGRFLWVKDWAALVVVPAPVELQATDIKATFNEDSLDEIEYAEGVVKNGVFYAEILATERN